MSDARATFREALRLYAAHNRVLLAAGALLLLPVGIMQVLAETLEGGTAAMPWSDDWSRSASAVARWTIDFFALLISYAVLTLLIADRLAGGNLGWREGWTRLLGRSRSVVTGELAGIVPTLGWAFVVGVPLSLLATTIHELAPASWMVPKLGVLAMGVMVWLVSALMAFLTPVTVLEQKPGFDAVARNAQLRGTRWRFVAKMLLPVVAARFVADSTLEWLFSDGPLASGVQTLVSWLLGPLEVACVVLVYVGVRTQTEGYTTEQLRADVDAPAVM